MFGKKNRKVLFIFPHWAGKVSQYAFASHIFSLLGYQCITYGYNADILTPNLETTVQNFQSVTDDALQKIVDLKRQGYNSFSVVGTSLGSSLAVLLANSSRDIKRIVLNLTGVNTAEIIWSWDNDKVLKHFKNELIAKKVSLNKLKKALLPISPDTNSTNIIKRKIVVFLAEKDEIIPLDQGKKLVYLLQKQQNDVKVYVNKQFRHFWTAVVNGYALPFYLLYF